MLRINTKESKLHTSSNKANLGVCLVWFFNQEQCNATTITFTSSDIGHWFRNTFIDLSLHNWAIKLYGWFGLNIGRSNKLWQCYSVETIKLAPRFIFPILKCYAVDLHEISIFPGVEGCRWLTVSVENKLSFHWSWAWYRTGR